ncbi:hypothetical protein GOP47_0010723 [Adiantum capillus-veneris]|uniref:N-lysine methyltransferase n=1 Tax=Adiantum capillus-veneris TaxID=13818 RepID=A0A9D4UVV1_ADICA|nr:hypothetical protein GOP47_0010723 [Adiantum capillus-veneris]
MASSTAARRRLRSFLRWMTSWGIQISDGLEIVEGVNNGISCGEFGVRAAYDFQDGDAIAFIPKDACLTLRTTGAAHTLDKAQLGGGLGLVVALMYERSRGEASPWFPYLNLLPLRHGALPIVWEREEIDALLLGTELHLVAMEDRRLMEEDWRECIWPLTEVYSNEFPKEHFTLEHYLSAKTLVASRSFEVDDFHGYGMVPLADLFNHKTSKEDVHIMREADSDLPQKRINFGRASPEVESDCLGPSRVEEISDGDSHSPLESAKGKERSDVLEMVLIRDVSGGSEIFNTYGELSNACLLHRHGFTETDNRYDIVNIDFTLVMYYSASFFPKRHVRNRVRLWRKYGCSALRWKTTEYFEIEQERATVISSGKSRDLGGVFLTAQVCEALLWLSERRDEAYGQTSLEEDLELLDVVNPVEEPKLFHALSLRISERSILKRLYHFSREKLGTPQKM